MVLNERAQTTRPLEENTDVNLHELGSGNGFFDVTLKTQATRKI
jgi:hypothetical protein